ncbi:YpmS family protein [Listeria booriae]|uniref:YpmS family protein n=1 Tax=Listeria booriae TaxID=1552123 RepID=A0A842A9I6_9LIST|nr:YpmS family protein [Listeria booriae]MBC1615576.1 YpmS family protein [Listeria booriae]
MLRSKDKQTNYWKWAFLTFIGILVLCFGWIYMSIFWFSPSVPEDAGRLVSTKDMVEFSSSTNKADLNKLIAHYLQDFQEDQDADVAYDVYLADDVVFKAEAQFLGQPVDLSINFSPTLRKDGVVVLQQVDLKVGALPLPVSYVMKYVKSQFELPDWVTISPKNAKIYLDVNKLKLKGGMKVRVDALDLKKDDISFTLLVPTE